MQTKPGRVLRHAARSLRQACGQGRTAGMRKKPSTAVMVAEGFCLPERAAITGRSSRSTLATGTGNQNTADKGFAEPDGRKFVRNVAVNADTGKRGSGKHRRARIAQVSGGADPNWRSGAPMQREPDDDDGGNGGRRACISGGIRPLGSTAAEPSNCHDKLYG